MAQRSESWFRRTGRVTLTRDDGSQAEGFGLVIPWGEEQTNLWGERSHPMGRLPGPLYQFVGSFPLLLEARGAKLTQGDAAYRVLRPEAVALSGKRLFERALLERWED